ncbi:MAG: DGQHR domain-containing protein [Nitrososphaerota archaeon]
MEVGAFRIKQWGYGEGASPAFIYVTALPLRFLTEGGRAKIDRWSRKNREGYQRSPLESRVKPRKGSVVKYILDELGVFPTSVLLNVRDNTLKFMPAKKLNENIEYGTLHIDDSTSLWIIDGQHRIEALIRASAEHPELEEYPLPVSILNLSDKFDELVHFYIVNSRQKKIPTGIAYRHMQQMYEAVKIRATYQWLESVILGAKQERQALAAMVVDYLDTEPESPFAGRIRFQGEELEKRHLIDDDVLIRYISTLLREKVLASMTVEELAELLIWYWSAISELYPRAFKQEEKDKYTLLKHTGVASFTYLFPYIYGLCAKEGKIDKNSILAKLELLKKPIPSDSPSASELDADFRRPIDEEWWSKDHGPSIARATSEATFRTISEKLAKKINILLKVR